MDGSTCLSCTRPVVPPSAQLRTRYIRQNQVRQGSTQMPTMPATRAQKSNLRIKKKGEVSERIQKIKSLRKQTVKTQQEKAEKKSRNFYTKGHEFLD